MDERAVLERALETLQASGAEGDAYLESRRVLRLQVRDGRLEEISRAQARGLAVRAIREGRLGFAHTSAPDLEVAAVTAGQACDLARFGTPRDNLNLADPAGPGDGRDEGAALGLFDQTIPERPTAEKEAWIRDAEAAARGADPRITRSEGCSYNEVLAAYWIANTRGLFRHYRKSRLEVGLSIAAEAEGELQPGERSAQAIRWAELPDPARFGNEAAERGVRLLGGRPVASGRYPVVFSPEVGWTLLIYLANALRGDHLASGRSWLAGRSTDRIGADLVTVVDDGRVREGPACQPFDGEGVDTQRTVLVEHGEIRGQLLDLASAKRLGLPPTGNARRGGYEQAHEIGPSNLFLRPGSAKPEALWSELSSGLWVWGVSGWWIGLDPSNPSYSTAAFGLWVENGIPSRPVARVTLSGRLDEILSGVDAVALDLTWDHPTRTPTFRVAELSVSGT